jgi:hypothetical protein
MKIYGEQNIRDLIELVRGDSNKMLFPFNHWAKLRKDLQVHTQGKLFEKVISVFENEDVNATRFVLNTYEPITKGSIWKGIDNISRIFKNTGFNIITDARTHQFIEENDYKEKIIENFIKKSISSDPNTFAVPYRRNEKEAKQKGFEWEIEFIESTQIDHIGEDYIVYVNEENSEYEIKKVHSPILNALKGELQYKNGYNSHILLEDWEKIYTKKSYVYISKYQYVTIDFSDSKAITEVYNFPTNISIEPYIATGVNEQLKNVYQSPVQEFIPFGNKALLQHRTAVSVENLFGYPRMSELELPCDSCHHGKVACDITEECPTGENECAKCNGTGQVSLQSIFKIYKRKLSPENPELNVNIDPVKFHTPDIGILEHVAKAWKETLQLAEESIYIQQRVVTGNVESAKSRETQLESMYSWLDRISSEFYESAGHILSNFCLLNGYDKVNVEKPISFAIMNELESFDYLNMIVSSDSPIFIKTTHIENFLKKYISSSNPIIRVVNILKKVDIFCFYTSKDLQTLSNSGIINDKQWRIHAYAFPVLSQMFAIESELFSLTDEQIIAKLNTELNQYINVPTLNG